MEFDIWLNIFADDVYKSIATSGTTNVAQFVEDMYMEYLASLHDVTEYEEVEKIITYNP